MDVVGHQTEADQRELVEPAAFAQEVEVRLIVPLGVENLPTSIATLRNVMRNADGDHAGKPSHMESVHRRATKSRGIFRLSPDFGRRSGVSKWVLRAIPAVCLVTLAAAGQDVTQVLKSIERRYNNARTLAVRFEQTFVAQKRRRTERGELFLRKPGRMRWQYASPAGKLFVSDGKHFYLYTPDNNRVERTPVKESDDWRAPLAFLLGKLDFQRDFKRFLSRPEGADTWIVAEPRSDRLAYAQVGFLVNTAFEIKRLEVTGQDQSVMEYRFEGERLNPPLEESLFRFQTPPGAEVVDTERGAAEGMAAR